MMSKIDEVVQILKTSRAVEQDFLGRLSPEDRGEQGDYENWSAKDLIAHVNYWPAARCEQIEAWLEDDEAKAIPYYEQSNLECYKMFEDQSWEQVEQYGLDTHNRLSNLVKRLDEQTLLGPSPDSEDRTLWELIVQVGYSHKLIHFSDFFIRKGKPELSGELWGEWAELVSPLDNSARWQGRVHYNAACGLALAGEREEALVELRESLGLQPGMKPWARRDPDLFVLHGSPEFKALIAADYWWEALEGGTQAEAVADQFIRTFTMLREAVEACPEDEWLRGDSNYQRPAGLALHIAQTAAMYSALKPGDSLKDPLMQIPWEAPDADLLPDQDTYLVFLGQVERRLATFLMQADLDGSENQFPWTGSSQLSRALYTLRHTQHHLADMAMELEHRGLHPPDWA